MITQDQLDLIHDESAFTDPIRIEAPAWVSPVCAVLILVIFVATVSVIGCPVGWLVG